MRGYQQTRREDYFQAMAIIEQGGIDGSYRLDSELQAIFKEKELLTSPPKTGPDFVIVFWDNLGVKEGGGYESKAVYGGKDYWDAAGSRSYPGPREEDRGGLSQSWDF
jgi:hypothetical protein